MGLLERLPLGDLGAGHVWKELDADTRRLAAEALYRSGASSESGRRHADVAIAARLNFREVAVRRLPVERRVQYLVARVRPDDTLASSLLLALHLDLRRPLLEAFLTLLEIPNDEGLIREDHELRPPERARLVSAAERLYLDHAAEEVDLYLASLVALDREIWSGLVPVLHARIAAPA